jgi:hypothetical protein
LNGRREVDMYIKQHEEMMVVYYENIIEYTKHKSEMINEGFEVAKDSCFDGKAKAYYIKRIV